MAPQRCPRQSAEQSLAAARSGGDRRREALGLADLVIMRLYEGDPHEGRAGRRHVLRVRRGRQPLVDSGRERPHDEVVV